MNEDLSAGTDRSTVASFFSGRLKERFGEMVEEVILYGSVANKNDTKDSDINLLILLKKDDPHLWVEICEMCFGFYMMYGEIISPLCYTREKMERFKDLEFFREIRNNSKRI
jgi:predicted nucleotidyltransferase